MSEFFLIKVLKKIEHKIPTYSVGPDMIIQ